ncbi:menadione-induced gene-12 [Colletotrichum costaricense]|uniref:Menadione-induced gene-12 n=1 Tax=Colletotrichum costaricense TaxID=1209916 RepID=A0AAI9YIR3_9PEZI|nr:menadione-induced gene-12 [Colletotrichum costaricense]KAK1511382.1 menadione-induced gene-12 [Colletotrichum costaricense]
MDPLDDISRAVTPSTEKMPATTVAHGWRLKDKIHELQQRDQAAGLKKRELGVTWTDLTVRVPDAEVACHENCLSQFHLASRIRRMRHQAPMQTILHHSHGCVLPGEMLLVLGRPGSGCSTLLKILSNRRKGFSEIDGNVFFGSMTHKEAEAYRGQIIMNDEEEIFFPSLTVGQTLDFATKLKVPSHHSAASDQEYSDETKHFLLDSLGIAHTANTKVGNEYIRGVSGGERKRVSVLECLASRASVFCWDNSTRGLDASNALEWAKAMRAMTDVHGLSTIATLYQASNDIFNLFDQVLILDQGTQIFYGPREEARGFMEDQGFICHDGANVADFLTGVTVPTERQIQPGYEKQFPRNADEIYNRYRHSPTYAGITDKYQYPDSQLAQSRTRDFKTSVEHEQHSIQSVHNVAFASQVWICVVRQYQILVGDLATFLMKQGASLIQALVAGSLYYNAPSDSTGLFLKGGILFWSLLYYCLTAMSEVVDSFSGRPVILKHRTFAYFHPAATCMAQISADVPVVLFQITVWSLIVYFMVHLTPSVGAFFTYWLILVMNNLCSIAMFRAIGAASGTFDGASKISGYVISAMAMYTGYQITKTQMRPWLGWLYWINPLSYGFEALMGNELHLKVIDCAQVNLIPHGASYTDTVHQACAGVGGAEPGATAVNGDDYLASLSYRHSNVWRNFGILCAWWIFYVAITVVATMCWSESSSSGASLLIPREKLKQHQQKRLDDNEAQVSDGPDDNSGSGTETLGMSTDQIAQSSAVFTWKNLSYTVRTSSGPMTLLHNVHGWVQPGTLTALMGSSGAGKTTLLDVLAQRKTEGRINGSVLVNGRPLPVSFQRSTGYVEQLDVHEPFATVREALEFSALLRQPRDTPKQEKLKYVDIIIDMLELHDLADTLIGQPGTGNSLNVEQRKRLTIAVELVAKPKFLIFLDEPTSGLDGQSAYNTVRFLRKLADVGQGVLVTVHQPSAQLFSQFDRLLLLARGGRTVYFGDIGHNGQVIQKYFGRHGAHFPPGVNPADYMIDVVSGRLSDTDWHEIWLKSPEHAQTLTTLNTMLEPTFSDQIDHDAEHEYAMPLCEQTHVVLRRMSIALFRNTGYVNNKVMLHIGLGIFNGFTYWMIGNAVGDLQLRLFTVFVWMFVAPGVINQLQPLFIERRNLYDVREKKARIYSWKALVMALIVSELPYLVICGVLYFVCWYYTVGFSSDTQTAGAAFFIVLVYELLYTGIGQFIAAWAPNAVFASLLNPLLVGALVSFCGILVPYQQITAFYRYWLYYLNPTTYLVGSMLTFVVSDAEVECEEREFALFNPPVNSTCLDYLNDYLTESGANLINPEASSGCRVCPYTKGGDYLRTLNYKDSSYGWNLPLNEVKNKELETG